MLRRVALVRTEASEELSASIIKVTRIGELGTMLAVISSFVFLRSVPRLLVTANEVHRSPSLDTLMMELSSSKTSVLARATRRNIPEDAILHSHRRENLKSYKRLLNAATQDLKDLLHDNKTGCIQTFLQGLNTYRIHCLLPLKSD
jgi:hypothetical protein